MTQNTDTRRAELEALDKLIEQRGRLRATHVLDDDYPEVQHNFEGALAEYLKAMCAHGRFGMGNRYGLLDLRS